MRTSFLCLQTLRISYPSLPPMWPAFEECEFQPSLNISKPMLDIVKLRIFLLCTLMSMKWPRYISWHPRRTLKLLFDLRKARRRSIMHSATHAGQFLRLAETQGGIGIGSTDGKVKKTPVFWVRWANFLSWEQSWIGIGWPRRAVLFGNIFSAVPVWFLERRDARNPRFEWSIPFHAVSCQYYIG